MWGLGDLQPHPISCMTILLVDLNYSVCMCTYMCNIYVIYTFIYWIHTFLYSIFIYVWCSKYVRDPNHTFFVRSLLTGLLYSCYTNTSFSYQALSLILPTLSQTASVLLWASLTLPYTRVTQKISWFANVGTATLQSRWCTCVPSSLVVPRHSRSSQTFEKCLRIVFV